MVYGIIQYEPLTHNSYDYPMWANVFGWLMAGSSMACIPIGAVVMIIKHRVGYKLRTKLVIRLMLVLTIFDRYNHNKTALVLKLGQCQSLIGKYEAYKNWVQKCNQFCTSFEPIFLTHWAIDKICNEQHCWINDVVIGWILQGDFKVLFNGWWSHEGYFHVILRDYKSYFTCQETQPIANGTRANGKTENGNASKIHEDTDSTEETCLNHDIKSENV